MSAVPRLGPVLAGWTARGGRPFRTKGWGAGRGGGAPATWPDCDCCPGQGGGRFGKDSRRSQVRRDTAKGPVRRAANCCGATVDYVRVDHGGRDVAVTEEFLHRA